MTGEVLSKADQEEALSIAYMQALAAGARYATSKLDFDRLGVDISIHSGGPLFPALHFQLKATINLGEPANGVFKFPLKIGNYQKLREPSLSPRFLAILSLPSEDVNWLTVTPAELIVRKCVYWISLLNYPEKSNTSSVTIDIPDANILNIESLQNLMCRARDGEFS